MSEQSKIRQLLERKIKQRMGHTEHANDYSNNFLLELESMKESYHSEVVSPKVLEGEELAHELSRQKQAQHQLQLSIDKLRIRMLEIAKEEDIVKEKIAQKRKSHSELKDRIEKEHENELKVLENNYELKRGNIAKQIQQLIQEKGQWIGKIETIAKEIKKGEERNKKAQQNYTKEMKSRKQAYLSIERQKSNKYQQGRIQQLKEQAVRDTEPKLLAIIKSANEDIKKAEETQKQSLEQFKIQYKLTLEKQLTDSKLKYSQDSEAEKQTLRQQTQTRIKQRLSQRQLELESQLTSLKQQYTARIREQQARMQKDMEQFINRNKDSHHSNIDEIRELKKSYQDKLKAMNENIRELQEQKLREYQDKYKNQYENQMKEIQETNEDKLKNAVAKIKADLQLKIEKIKKEITKEQSTFKEEIAVKYEKMFINQQKKLEDILSQERKQSESTQQKLINLQRQKSKEQTRTQQMQRQRNQLLSKRDDLQRKISNYEAQLAAFERLKLQKEKQGQKRREEINNLQQKQYQKLKNDYLAMQQQKQAKLKSLLDDFQQESNTLSQQLQQYRGQIQSNITRRKSQLQKLLEENSRLDRENDLLQRQIEQESKRLRS